MKTSGSGPNLEKTLAENEELRRRLEEAEDALRAIRDGEVDAIVVTGSHGDRVYSLAETENLHRLMVEAMNEVGIAATPDGTILFCNQRASSVLQRTPAEMLGKSLHEFVATQHAGRIERLVRDANPLAGERIIFIARDGLALPMQVWASRVESREGPIVCLVAADLTRLEADQALLHELGEQQEVLRARDRDLTAASGRLAEDLDAMSRLQRVAGMYVRGEDMQQILHEMLEAAVAISGGLSGDLQLIDPGTGRPYIVADCGFEPWCRQFWDEHVGQPDSRRSVWETGERVIVEDVELDPLFAGTDALEAHRRAGVRAVLLTPLRGPSLEVIGILSTHFAVPGRPDARILGWLELLARETADIIGRADTEATLHRRQEELEKTQQALKDSHRELEEMVKQRTSLSEERGDKLRVMASALSSAEQEERRRLAQVLHDDLQQMLVAIRLRLASLENVVVGTALGSTVSGINGIVDNAITAARSLTTELSPPIMREPLPQVIEWLARWFETRHGLFVTMTADDAVKEPTIEAKKFLFQAVRELLVNVRKHAGTEYATVHISSPSDEVVITVSDEGKGLDPALVTAHDDNAFGLYSIRERVELLGGSFSIAQADKGTICEIRMPALPLHALPRKTEQPGSTPAKTAPFLGRPVRILVVDDHTIFRRGLISILESYPDLRVVGEASDGEEGVAKASSLLPDVVIMDLAMPRMNGIEATRIIKSRFQSVDVLALSFQESEHARSSVLEAGASEYFTKSGPLDNLLRAIRAHSGGDGGGAPSGDGNGSPRDGDSRDDTRRAEGQPPQPGPHPTDGDRATHGAKRASPVISKTPGDALRRRRA